MVGCLLIFTYNGTVQTGYMNASHPSSLHHHSRIQQQLKILTNVRTLEITSVIIPFSINNIKTDTVMCTIIWLTSAPIFKDQFSLTTCVNPWPSFCINTNPNKVYLSSGVLFSKDNFSSSKDLVKERFGLGFYKTSSCESIHICCFTEFLGISIIFFVVKIEAVENI